MRQEVILTTAYVSMQHQTVIATLLIACLSVAMKASTKLLVMTQRAPNMMTASKPCLVPVDSLFPQVQYGITLLSISEFH